MTAANATITQKAITENMDRRGSRWIIHSVPDLEESLCLMGAML